MAGRGPGLTCRLLAVPVDRRGIMRLSAVPVVCPDVTDGRAMRRLAGVARRPGKVPAQVMPGLAASVRGACLLGAASLACEGDDSCLVAGAWMQADRVGQLSHRPSAVATA